MSVKGTPNREEKKQQEGKSNFDEKQPATQLNLYNTENTKSDTQQVLILHPDHEVCIKISRGASKKKDLRGIYFII